MAIHEQLLAAVGDRRGVGAADRLCEACVVLFGVDAAAISLVFDGTNVGTLGASGVSARVYDELQFTLGEGPCLDSVAHRAPVVVVDLADPDVVRWPAYGPAMLAHQIRGVYAMPVVVAGQYVGALDLFGSPRCGWVPSSWPVRCWRPSWPRCRCWISSQRIYRPPLLTPTAIPGPS